MSEVVYKVRLDNGTVTVSHYFSKSKHELIEEMEVPEGEDPEEYAQLLREEVFLGDMCESKTRY